MFSRKELSPDDFSKQEDTVSLSIAASNVDKATKLLSDNGIDVLSTDRTKVSLEDYYFDLIGGGEDA